jgi:hypothetical protein
LRAYGSILVCVEDGLLAVATIKHPARANGHALAPTFDVELRMLIEVFLSPSGRVRLILRIDREAEHPLTLTLPFDLEQDVIRLLNVRHWHDLPQAGG